MAETPVPITPGTGGASIASDLVSGNNYQQIKVVDATIGSNNPWKINSDGSAQVSVIGTITASIIGTVPVNIISGSPNQSVSGTVVTISQGSVAAVIVGGSIAASFTPPANQSVSGTVGASVIGNVPVVVQSSVATVIIGGSIAASFTPPANQSISGTVGASIIGQLPSGTAVIGSITTLQGTNPWNIAGSVTAFINSSNSSVITVSQSSVAVAIVSGSISATFTPPANQSVSGTIGASIIGAAEVYFPPALTSAGTDNNSQLNWPTGIGSGNTGPLGGANYVFDRSGGSVWSRWTGNSSVGALVSTGQSSVITVVQGSIAVAMLQGSSVSGTVGSSIIGIAPVLPAVYVSSVQGITSVMTGTSSVLVLGAPGGTSRNYITHILVTNGAAVSTQVTIQDGASILWGGFAAASGGGWSENFNPPLPQPTSVKALYATSSIQASVIVAINGFTGT